MKIMKILENSLPDKSCSSSQSLPSEEALKELSAEEVFVLNKLELVENEATRNGCGEAIKYVESVFQEVADEICSDIAYNQASNDTEKVDADELARDNMFEKVIVSMVTKPFEEKIRCGRRNMGEVWKYWCLNKLERLSIKMNNRREFDKSLLNINQVNLKLTNQGLEVGLDQMQCDCL